MTIKIFKEDEEKKNVKEGKKKSEYIEKENNESESGINKTK